LSRLKSSLPESLAASAKTAISDWQSSAGQNATTAEKRYTFDGVKVAPAPGDFQVLAERGRRALRVHPRSDVNAGLETLRAGVQKALA
ncbi:MAG TPA: hypothetical protein VMU26_21795, partial [Candidatus Polarisedimenticolia bacterium]|nr:hypothetical protein [Candidatus Polarisedimenticolia bacterium]